jgi:hypothetical protein
LNISSSEIPLTFGKGTENRAAFSFRFLHMSVGHHYRFQLEDDCDTFCLMAEERAFADFSLLLSSKYEGSASVAGSAGSEDLTLRVS